MASENLIQGQGQTATLFHGAHPAHATSQFVKLDSAVTQDSESSRSTTASTTTSTSAANNNSNNNNVSVLNPNAHAFNPVYYHHNNNNSHMHMGEYSAGAYHNGMMPVYRKMYTPVYVHELQRHVMIPTRHYQLVYLAMNAGLQNSWRAPHLPALRPTQFQPPQFHRQQQQQAQAQAQAQQRNGTTSTPKRWNGNRVGSA